MSKYINCIFILILLAVACKNNPTPTNTNSGDTARVDTVSHKDTIAARQWIIKDSSLYSRNFLKELYDFKDAANNSVSLVDNYVVYGKDTSYFPDYFQTNKQYVFLAKNDSGEYKLILFNATYTRVQFDLSVIKNKKLAMHCMGEAEIPAGFFQATETDDDENADSTFNGTYDYHGENDKYEYALSLGTSDNTIQAQISCFAKDSARNKNLNNCPTLTCAEKYTPRHK